MLIQKLLFCVLYVCIHFGTWLLTFLIMTTDESYLTNVYWKQKLTGMKNFRPKDLIDIIRTTDPNDFMVEFFIEVTDNVHRGSAIVINTSHELESDALNALSSMFPFSLPHWASPIIIFKSNSTEPLGIFRFQSLEGKHGGPWMA